MIYKLRGKKVFGKPTLQILTRAVGAFFSFVVIYSPWNPQTP